MAVNGPERRVTLARALHDGPAAFSLWHCRTPPITAESSAAILDEFAVRRQRYDGVVDNKPSTQDGGHKHFAWNGGAKSWTIALVSDADHSHRMRTSRNVRLAERESAQPIYEEDLALLHSPSMKMFLTVPCCSHTFQVQSVGNKWGKNGSRDQPTISPPGGDIA